MTFLRVASIIDPPTDVMAFVGVFYANLLNFISAWGKVHNLDKFDLKMRSFK